MRPYLAQIRFNLRLMMRDRAVLFFSFLFPLVFFFLFAQMVGGAKDPGAMTIVIDMVLVIGILNNGFFGAGMRTVQDRETNVLRRFKVAPIGPMPVLIANVVSGLINFVPVVIAFFVLAAVLYKTPLPPNLWSILVFAGLGVVAFRALGVIIGAVVNSAAEAQIIVQVLYMPMLFLCGATFPISIMPVWLQVIAGFLPATYLFTGLQSLLVAHESLAVNWASILALAITTAVSLFIASKLFRWEKEEKISPRAKMWILAVLAPFFILGAYQGETKQNIQKEKALARQADRKRSILFTNTRIFVGDGNVIASGAVLIRNGKIERVFDRVPADTKSFNADVWDESGRTLMPGLIDMHVHIGAPGGMYADAAKYNAPDAGLKRLAAYLYCGITAVRSTGDWLDMALKLRSEVRSGEEVGADYFTYGPLFTAPGGHPTEMIAALPEQIRQYAQAQFVRLPSSTQQARQEVDALSRQHIDGIKAVLESGSAVLGSFNHLAPDIYRAVIDQARADHLPSATHTGDSADVKEAADAGTNTVEHGSARDSIPVEMLAELKAKGIAYDPTLSVLEGLADFAAGNTAPLDRSLVQRVEPADLLADTRAALAKSTRDPARIQDLSRMLATGKANLLAAYKAGVPLIAGSDAGNPLVFHGPTIQNELRLWVNAGIPNAVALEAATYNAAQYLRSTDHFGIIAPGRDATFLLLDGDPLSDIGALERISEVFLKGEQIRRAKLLHPDD